MPGHGIERRPPGAAGALASRSLAVAIIAAGWASGCGSAAFSAEELVAELNDRGAAIELGASLAEGPEATGVHAIELRDPEGDDHAGGSLAITDGDAEALAEYRRCEEAASLLCFRVANAVLIFEDSIATSDLAGVRRAVQAIAGD